MLLTAESKLIAALRQESEAQLKQKDQAILDIQGRLSAIDRERQELRTGVQAALSAKEQELLGQFERRLQEERRRLQGQGVSPEEIQRRLADTEAALRRDNEAALAAARRQAEAELASKEAAIASLAGQYQRELEQARTERTQARGEMERREAEHAAGAGRAGAGADYRPRPGEPVSFPPCAGSRSRSACCWTSC